MIKIADLVQSLSDYLEAQRQLAQCRRGATGDVDYYCHAYAEHLRQSSANFEQALNDHIDQRIADKLASRDLLHLSVPPAGNRVAA